MPHASLQEQLRKFSNRLSESMNELSAYSKVFEQYYKNINVEHINVGQITEELSGIIMSGYYAHYLAQESHALIMIMKEFVPTLENAYKQAKISTEDQNLEKIKQTITVAEPLITEVLKNMEPFKTRDVEHILKTLADRRKS
jgi:hypothetical protein